MLLKELCYIETKTINPQNYPEKNFLHYSLPNFDIDRKPKYEKGKYIMSAKYIVPQNAILFNKLNVRFKRIWNVQDNTYPYSICSGELLPLVVNNSCVIQKYLYYYLLTDKVNNILVENAHGTSTSHQRIKPINLMNIEVPIPLIKKQNHIVDIIGSIDNLIESNTVALNSIESLINNIFHAHYILWKEKKELGKVFTCILGGTPSTKNVEYWDGNIPWINSGEVNNLRISTPTKYITKLGLEKSATKLLPTGTTVIAITGATLGQVSLLEIDSCANQSVIGILENKEYKRDYIYPLMNKIIKELILNQTGGAQQHINKNDVQSFIINIPNIQQYEEYTKIVLPLLNHQSMIVKQNNKLTNLKQKYLNKFFE